MVNSSHMESETALSKSAAASSVSDLIVAVDEDGIDYSRAHKRPIIGAALAGTTNLVSK